MITIRQEQEPDEKRRIAAQILADLPEWFGLPESTAEYVRESGENPMWTALLDGEEAGFIVQKQTSDAAVEICVMGVKKRYHRQGIGARLWQAFASDAREKGFSYAQVKTVAAGRYLEYDRTRAFYERMGFQALEVFPTLWDAWNPCLLMVQKL